jgi:hypothetical protein
MRRTIGRDAVSIGALTDIGSMHKADKREEAAARKPSTLSIGYDKPSTGIIKNI